MRSIWGERTVKGGLVRGFLIGGWCWFMRWLWLGLCAGLRDWLGLVIVMTFSLPFRFGLII